MSIEIRLDYYQSVHPEQDGISARAGVVARAGVTILADDQQIATIQALSVHELQNREPSVMPPARLERIESGEIRSYPFVVIHDLVLGERIKQTVLQEYWRRKQKPSRGSSGTSRAS